jgi:DNA-binding PadR family transcriptional regulator
MAKDLYHEFFLGFIRLHILHHASQEEVFGMEFHKELARHGYAISFGTLYPIFHRLEKSGFIVSRTALAGGKQRRYYRATKAGLAALAEAKTKARELVDELFAKKGGRK